MKIGILTLHSQLNYGGVLQAWAMQQYLQEQGHEAIILDRWPPSSLDVFPLARGGARFCDWLRQIIRMFFFVNAVDELIRAFRTNCFLKRRCVLSPYHFSTWEDAPADLGVDQIFVGSDQVWNPYNCRDGFFLLEGAPMIPAVAQAASFGVRELPEGMADRYRRGLARFSKIRVREKEGVAIAEKLGFKAEHVDDPTLCASPEVWGKLVKKRPKVRQQLTCYFLSEDIMDCWNALLQFSKENKWEVRIYLASSPVAFPSSPRKIMRWLKWHFRRRHPLVCLRLADGPLEFVQAFCDATAVVSDSFHALMFSSIFNVPIWNLMPRNEQRRGMFSRILEFQSRYSKANVAATVQHALCEVVRSVKGEPV